MPRWGELHPFAAAAPAVPLAAALGTAAPASAEPRCEIRYRRNGSGNISSTAWVDASTCGRRSHIKVTCIGARHSRAVEGNVVTTGTTKAGCTAILEAVYMQYKVGGT
ncbi:hypothetical protein [Actinomadura macrotermitis]|uniref:Uncharacterized protein n=1 Tax=Actinomadura macrotermitis TaxID=2585200 RepID=A0A7K0C1E0_9ACTN|nr:hypothetical protein [Actinomadura macrotermitis]MQY07281.1 hypothetical protein [Actinomadura macrotermitis]